MKDTITLPRKVVEHCMVACSTNGWFVAESELQAALDAPAPKVEPAHPTDLEKVIDDYIEYYEMHGESEDGRDAIYTPTENDKALLKDAILGLLVDTDWDAAWGAHIDSLVSARAAKIETWTDADADAARLALELECLLNDTADMSIVSKWWASSMEALDLHRARMSAKPNTLKKLDAMERLLIARQQPAPKAEPPKPIFSIAIAERQWRSLQDDGYTMKHIAFEGKGKAGTIDVWGKVLWTEWPKPTEDPMLACDIAPRPLEYPLSHYHLAIGGGPLHFTWKDKPHRLVYDLIAAVKYYAQQAQPQQVPLTEEQIFDLAGNYDCGTREENERWIFTSPKQLLTFVRAIEAASIKEGS